MNKSQQLNRSLGLGLVVVVVVGNIIGSGVIKRWPPWPPSYTLQGGC